MRKSTVLILVAFAASTGFVLGSRNRPASVPPQVPSQVEFDLNTIESLRISRSGVDEPVQQGKYRVAVVFTHGSSKTHGQGVPNPVCIEFGGGSGLVLAPTE